MKKVSLLIILLAIGQTVFGQYQIGIVPRISSDKMIYQKIGNTEIEIRYGSPSINNRQLWGELVPYDKVWRAGANSATTIEFNSSVIIDNKTLEKGKYSFFLIPKENDKWTVIFNKISKQWGAFKYDKREDALRFEVSPRATKSKTENLTYTIYQKGFKYGSIILSWDFIEIEIHFETNYLLKFEKEIDKRAEKQPEYLKWIVYIQGAEHLIQIGFKLDLALLWINKAEKIMNITSEWNEQFYPRDYVKGHLYWTKAKLLAKNNNFLEAIAYVQKLKTLKNTMFYNRKNENESIETSLSLWKNK